MTPGSLTLIPPVVFIITFLSYKLIPPLISKIEIKVFNLSLPNVSAILVGYGVNVFETRLSTSIIIALEPSLTTVKVLPETKSPSSLLVIKYSDGLSIDSIPFSVIWKKPVSPVLPNLFLELINPLSSSSLFASIIKTVSTKCSKALRPASSSALVI